MLSIIVNNLLSSFGVYNLRFVHCSNFKLAFLDILFHTVPNPTLCTSFFATSHTVCGLVMTGVDWPRSCHWIFWPSGGCIHHPLELENIVWPYMRSIWTVSAHFQQKVLKICQCNYYLYVGHWMKIIEEKIFNKTFWLSLFVCMVKGKKLG